MMMIIIIIIIVVGPEDDAVAEAVKQRWKGQRGCFSERQRR